MRKPARSGGHDRRQGIAVTAVGVGGKVLIDGEYWDAMSETAVEEGRRIRVLDVRGLKLVVEEEENKRGG